MKSEREKKRRIGIAENCSVVFHSEPRTGNAQANRNINKSGIAICPSPRQLFQFDCRQGKRLKKNHIKEDKQKKSSHFEWIPRTRLVIGPLAQPSSSASAPPSPCAPLFLLCSNLPNANSVGDLIASISDTNCGLIIPLSYCFSQLEPREQSIMMMTATSRPRIPHLPGLPDVKVVNLNYIYLYPIYSISSYFWLNFIDFAFVC